MAFAILFKLVSLAYIVKDWLDDSQGQSYQSAYSLLVGVDRRQA